ncbi:hypothetical protein LQT97_12375 [Brucella pseudogrignonensis]|uniref:cyclophilin-like fold protein n=1 Tax=Brucella pseudogrignonensis TaxID=419475 RepID=UPI001E6334E7|nr:cyclophilin-like fold protein [Brucella pseudogrignonensis]MCD4512028.1 hypothetical protein [Brucella pseudogrignonensis]
MLKTLLPALASMAMIAGTALAAETDRRGIKVKVIAGNHVATATFIDNATTRALVAQFPLTVPMLDRYGRELVHRFPDALPANETTTSRYEVGDIVYWTPRHSFVIMYAQNGERISNLQKVGRIDSGIEALGNQGDTNVTFELLNK